MFLLLFFLSVLLIEMFSFSLTLPLCLVAADFFFCHLFFSLLLRILSRPITCSLRLLSIPTTKYKFNRIVFRFTFPRYHFVCYYFAIIFSDILEMRIYKIIFLLLLMLCLYTMRIKTNVSEHTEHSTKTGVRLEPPTARQCGIICVLFMTYAAQMPSLLVSMVSWDDIEPFKIDSIDTTKQLRCTEKQSNGR